MAEDPVIDMVRSFKKTPINILVKAVFCLELMEELNGINVISKTPKGNFGNVLVINV